jgi:hypothetical protein
MTPNEFKKFLHRDTRCWHCGTTDETLIPQHRANRGMGGVKSRNRPSNIIVFCASFNQLIEADSGAASLARSYGWKISGHDDPAFVPVFDVTDQAWYFLGDDYSRTVRYEG